MAKRDDKLNELFFAICDPTRRRILDLLREAEVLSVTQIAEAFAMSLNGVSKHIKVLEDAGVVEREVEWRTHKIRPNWQRLSEGFEYFSAYHHFWNQRLDAFVKAVEKKED